MRYFLASVLALRGVNILHVALLPVSVPAVQILRPFARVAASGTKFSTFSTEGD